MIRDSEQETFVTTHFRTPGFIGAGLFTLAPPAFIYEMYLMFYTTAVEENQAIGLFAAVALILSFASVPLMIVGRRQRHSLRPSLG